MASAASDADVILNRANVALARSQRLIASWLPPPTTDEKSTTKSAEELAREEEALFTPVPDRLGLGAPLPKDVEEGSARRQELASNEKLRKAILGKRALQQHKQAIKVISKSAGPTRSQNGMAQESKLSAEDDDDEEDSRTSLLKTKRPTPRISIEEEEISSSARDGEEESPARASRNPKKRSMNFLDQLLEEKSKKKKKSKSKPGIP